MKRYMAILGFVFVGILAGLLVRGIPIVLHVNAGGEIPRGSQNGDVNGDTRLDIGDAIYLLTHFFRGGPQPVALAQGSPALEDGINRTNQLLEEIANPCKERRDRYVRNGDGTTTDTCTGLMWLETTIDVTGDGVIEAQDLLNWEDALQFCDSLQFAGYVDWRLPTAEEMVSLHQRPLDYRASPWMLGGNPAIEPSWSGVDRGMHWTSTESVRTSTKAWMWALGQEPRLETRPKANSRFLILPVRTVQ